VFSSAHRFFATWNFHVWHQLIVRHEAWAWESLQWNWSERVHLVMVPIDDHVFPSEGFVEIEHRWAKDEYSC
jgi:hypothetical protein